MQRWGLSEDVLSDLRARTLQPGWDDRLYISEGAVLIPTLVYLQKKRGTGIYQALACIRTGLSKFWKPYDLKMNVLGELSQELPNELLPFLSFSSMPHDDPFPLLLDAPALAYAPDWICSGFQEVSDSTQGRVLRRCNGRLSLSVLYDAF
jgi:hypothetical protein